jgi:hypothetical protein
MENETNTLYSQIRELILSARKAVSHNIDAIQVFTNFETGRLIVEHEQKGSERAEYGKQTLKELSERLRTEFGRGYSLTNLKLMRRFYLMNKTRIGQTASDQLPPFSKGQTLSDQLAAQRKIQIAQTVSTQFEVVVHPKAKHASVNKFPILDMNGVPINLPEDENYYPHPEALEWHKKEVFNKFLL